MPFITLSMRLNLGKYILSLLCGARQEDVLQCLNRRLVARLDKVRIDVRCGARPRMSSSAGNGYERNACRNLQGDIRVT